MGEALLMPRTLLITNPAAARTDPRVVRTVRRVLRGEGWQVDIEKTKHTGHAAELAAEGVRAGVDVVAVYGGDGTAMQAVKGMWGHDLPLALIPGGTGNLLAGNLRLPRDPARAALVITRGAPRALDLGRMEREDGPRYFAVACGAGFDAELMATTTTESKRRWKMGAYVARAWETIGGVHNVPYRITVDGTPLEGEAATVMVANCSEFMPPFLRFGPGVAPDDGVFDVVVLRAEGFLGSAAVLLQWISGAGEGTDHVRRARGAVVTVEMEPPRVVQTDGEAAGRTPFTAELLAGMLRVMTLRGA
jgi:diacylglycerol kinase (ATP)